jgi:GT2 family glycosyltransferase
MTNRVAAIIVNYNMPERTNALVEYMLDNVKTELDIIVVDNGSDIAEKSRYTSVALAENVQTTNGWLAGLQYVDALKHAKGEEYFAYWFLITSAEFVGGDPLSPMLEKLIEDENAIGIHPALTKDSTTSWRHLITNGESGCRRTWMIDNIASLYRAEWFDSIGRFDPALVYAWGIDLETCFLARCNNKGIYVCEDAKIKKVTDIGYSMDRMNMSAAERQQKAGDNMKKILSAKYGGSWWRRMTQDNMPR